MEKVEASNSQVFAQALWSEKDVYYAEQFELSKPYPLVQFQYLTGGVFLYLLLVIWGYKRAATDAKPIITDGRWALRVYNAFQVILSGYIAYLASVTYLRKLISNGTVCQPMLVNIQDDPEEYELQTFCTWLFYMSKYVDFLDTIFIILRSKWRQLSFLHTFHHSTMIGLTWMAAYYFPCGYFLIAAQLNAPVHFIMYFYYLLSSFPSLTPFLWWKNYITSIQLLQFVTGTCCTVYCFWKTAVGHISGLSLIFCGLFILYGITLYYLFYSFYKATYKNKKAAAGGKSKKDL
jgi:elongation of very long chain fatty acids protein 4